MAIHGVLRSMAILLFLGSALVQPSSVTESPDVSPVEEFPPPAENGCRLSSDCGGGGVCELTGEGSRCLCKSGWSGPTCAEYSCSDQACVHGSCVQNICLCEAGWSGEDCSLWNCLPTGVCVHGDCLNNSCQCHAGWAKRTFYCDAIACDASTCTNGVCAVGGTCICGPGWHGVSCDVWSCANPGVCLNGGVCRTNQCQCPAGLSGRRCGVQDSLVFHGRDPLDVQLLTQITTLADNFISESQTLASLLLSMELMHNETQQSLQSMTAQIQAAVDRYFTCDRDWIVGEFKKYLPLKYPMKYQDAKDACKNVCKFTQTNLVVPVDLEELSDLFNISWEYRSARSLVPYNVWIGASLEQRVWRTVTGEELNSTLWAEDEPNDPESEKLIYGYKGNYNKVIMHHSADMGLFDESEDYMHLAICEQDL